MLNEKPKLFAVLTEYAYGLMVILFVAAVFLGIFWSVAPIPAEQYWYSFTRHVPKSRVFISPRPLDCYADRAPGGVKKCHYERVVDVVKDSSGNTQVTVHWQKVLD